MAGKMYKKEEPNFFEKAYDYIFGDEPKRKKSPAKKAAVQRKIKEDPDLLDRLTSMFGAVGETISDAVEKRTKTFGGSQGGMPRKRTGHTDFRKGGMVLKTTNNRRNT